MKIGRLHMQSTTCFFQDRALAHFVLREKRVWYNKACKAPPHTTQMTRTVHGAHTDMADHLAKHHDERGSTPDKETPTKKHPIQTLRHGGASEHLPYWSAKSASDKQNHPPTRETGDTDTHGDLTAQ
jgi:hypothetical protein